MIKNLPASVGDGGSIPGLGRCPVVGNGNPLQYSCLENLMEPGTLQRVKHNLGTKQQHRFTVSLLPELNKHLHPSDLQGKTFFWLISPRMQGAAQKHM